MVVSNPTGVTKLPTKMDELLVIELVVIIVCAPVFGITNKSSETGTVDVVGPSKYNTNPLLIPFIPAAPVAPWKPCAPVAPVSPCTPVEPCSPVTPCAPPAVPCAPCTPCGPLQQSPVAPLNP